MSLLSGRLDRLTCCGMQGNGATTGPRQALYAQPLLAYEVLAIVDAIELVANAGGRIVAHKACAAKYQIPERKQRCKVATHRPAFMTATDAVVQAMVMRADQQAVAPPAQGQAHVGVRQAFDQARYHHDAEELRRRHANESG